MWAVWSTKARGGYAELLFLGEALLLATLPLRRTHTADRLALLWGLLAGLAFWTHLLAIVYLLPAAGLPRARHDAANWRPRELAPGRRGRAAGHAAAAVSTTSCIGLPTLQALLQPADMPLDPVAQFIRFFRVGVPVLAGLGQPTTSDVLFDQDWLQRPAGQAWVARSWRWPARWRRWPLHLPALKALRRDAAPIAAAEPALLLLLALRSCRRSWP